METIDIEKTKYNKDTIYKWREKNKESYLSKLSNYNSKRYNEMKPDKKKELIDKIKMNIKKRREKEKLERPTDIIIKRGRPRKHEIILTT